MTYFYPLHEVLGGWRSIHGRWAWRWRSICIRVYSYKHLLGQSSPTTETMNSFLVLHLELQIKKTEVLFPGILSSNTKDRGHSQGVSRRLTGPNSSETNAARNRRRKVLEGATCWSWCGFQRLEQWLAVCGWSLDYCRPLGQGHWLDWYQRSQISLKWCYFCGLMRLWQDLRNRMEFSELLCVCVCVCVCVRACVRACVWDMCIGE